MLHSRDETEKIVDEKDSDSSIQMIQSVESLKEVIKSEKENSYKKRETVKKDDNKCTLKDFLELLDGFPPINGSIIYMTANDITKLDSALIRPGRINIRQFFGNISKKNSIKFIENYYSRLMTEEQKVKYKIKNILLLN